MRNEALISMRFVRSKLRKREESSNAVDSHDTTTQPTQVVSTIEPVGFRQTPSSVWHFPPLPPQPNIFIYNASSQVSTQSQFFFSLSLSPTFRHCLIRAPHEFNMKLSALITFSHDCCRPKCPLCLHCIL